MSTVLEGILGWWGGLWLPARERTLTAVTQEKHLLCLCFDLFCRFFSIFSFFFPSFPLPPPCPHCTCQFYWQYEIYLRFWAFFSFLSHIFFTVVINLCLYIGLLQFCGVFLFFSFFFKKFLNQLLFFLHLFPCLLFLLFFSPCSFCWTVLILLMGVYVYVYIQSHFLLLL